MYVGWRHNLHVCIRSWFVVVLICLLPGMLLEDHYGVSLDLIIALFVEDCLKGSQTHTGLTDLLVWY